MFKFELDENGGIANYKTPAEIARDWGVSAQVARTYITRYNIPVLRISNRVFVVDGTPKPTKRNNRKGKKLTDI